MCGSLQLILRSINSSRSAYASISFINTFFDAYNIFGATVVQAGVLAKVDSGAQLPVNISVLRNSPTSQSVRDVCEDARIAKTTRATSVLQHALSLFRTQRIVKIFLQVDTQTNKLVANILADNGEALPSALLTALWKVRDEQGY